MNNLAKIFSAELEGIDARLIEVEVDLHAGLHSFNIVGLADKALSEAKERVNSAVKNSDLKPPNKDNRKITVNLAPADVKKTGSHYDLAIAIGYALSTEQIRPFDPADKIFVGELALNGDLRPIGGALNIAEMAQARGFSYVFVPAENAPEAALISDIHIVPVHNIREAVRFLEKPGDLAHVPRAQPAASATPEPKITLDDIRGQDNAKRALIIAAAGGHNLLMTGTPGAGKSLLAESMVSILPEATAPESIEIAKVWGAAGLGHAYAMHTRPFRPPHH